MPELRPRSRRPEQKHCDEARAARRCPVEVANLWLASLIELSARNLRRTHDTTPRVVSCPPPALPAGQVRTGRKRSTAQFSRRARRPHARNQCVRRSPATRVPTTGWRRRDRGAPPIASPRMGHVRAPPADFATVTLHVSDHWPPRDGRTGSRRHGATAVASSPSDWVTVLPNDAVAR